MVYAVARTVLIAQKNSANGKILMNHLSRDFHVFNTKIIKAFRPFFMSRSQDPDCLKSIYSRTSLSNFHTTDTTHVLFEREVPGDFDRYIKKALDPQVLQIKEEIRKMLTYEKNRSNQSSLETATDIAEDKETDRLKNYYISEINENIERVTHQIKEAIMKEFYTALETGCREQLVEYLNKKIQANCGIPELEAPKNFDYDLNGNEVIFKRKMGDEIIIVKADINDSLHKDAAMMYIYSSERNVPFIEADARFTVEIQNGKDVLQFLCLFRENLGKLDGYKRSHCAFLISEISLFENASKTPSYTVPGHLMDRRFYCLMLKYLTEKGVSNTFYWKMCLFVTCYQYNLLNVYMQGIKSVVEK